MHRTALITGVGRLAGLGAAIARTLAADGWDLALSYHRDYDERLDLVRSADDPGALADELRATGRRVELLDADLADPDVPATLLDRARDALGPVSALVLSHCESVDSSILDSTVESFDRHYAVNVRASWQLIKAFAEQLAGPGSIVALTSDHAVHNLPYGTTKAALDRLVVAAPYELTDLDLQANVINPGPIDTGWMSDDLRADVAAKTPYGVLGEPQTVADLVRFLLSPQGRWINGQRLLSNGGFASNVD
ncbi:SDR family oxidoreductase [Nigerium massiliense]|uniref:SDR family oxidoreductase n=1 Tax=Nigerium massiliense TaxID=1522317 RepID=UPI0005904D6A|nr:SDR family oxidoreductase [Nigerium massiliense]